MRHVLIAALAGMAAAASPAHATTSWPVAGGDPSRSGYGALDAGAAPVGIAWVRDDAHVRTPVVVSAGGGPDTQRVMYGTLDGRLHLRVLATGDPVGPAEGIPVDTGVVLNEGTTFGNNLAAIAPVDTSTADRLGLAIVVHNDQGAVQIARFDLRNGERVDEITVPSTVGCRAGASPLVTPPDPAGGRVLFFTLVGSCPANESLVRIPITGDAASRTSRLGEATFAPAAPIEGALPTLLVLRDGDGTPRFHVGIGRRGGLSFYDASRTLGRPPEAVPPDLSAPLENGEELAHTPIAAAADTGAPAGAAGTGTQPPPAVYVAATANGQARVYRFVQDGAARELRRDRVTAPLPESGAPGPAPALTEAMTPAGVTPGGRIVVGSAGNLTVLRTSDLGIVGRLAPRALPSGKGFGSTSPVVSGDYVYAMRDGADGEVPEPVVLRLNDLRPLTEPAFTPSGATGRGRAFGQPALARGWVITGAPGGAIAYRNRDVTAPLVELTSPPQSINRGTRLRARAFDARGVEAVAFRLTARGGPFVLGRDASGAGSSLITGGADYTIDLSRAEQIPDGHYELDAVATDSLGNAAASFSVGVKVSGLDDSGATPVRCALRVTGTRKGDRLRGTRASERINGGRGNDRIAAGAGDDCVAGGPGRDRISAGAGDDVVSARDRARDHIACGPGRDRVTADRADRVARDCERIRRR